MAGLVVGWTIGTSACGAGSTDETAGPSDSAAAWGEADIDVTTLDLALEFEEIGVPGDVVAHASNTGQAAVMVDVITAGGGDLVRTEHDGGSAVRTPAYRAEGDVPAAALVVLPAPGAEAELDPRTRDFLIGADFRIDPEVGRRPEDNGDNLVQRGRFGTGAQVKIDVDHGVPACRVSGTSGEVLVRADRPVMPDNWYRVSCERTGGEVRLTLTDLDGGGSPSGWTVRENPGDVALSGTPVSVGAKVTGSGEIDGASVDQFNGQVDRVVFDVRQ